MTDKFKFIDLFSGIGGFHLAMHYLGGECVFASEIDEHARKTYQHNFYSISPDLFDSGRFNDDIRKIAPLELPDFDVLCAGFPCQPFSQAGYKRGFSDNHDSERGTLFFNIAEIIEAKRPKAFFLENVRGIVNHDNGKTFKIIRKILEEELGYSFYFKIVHASDYGLPQLRPRAFMIGFRGDGFMGNFTFPEKTPLKLTMSDIWKGKCSRDIGFTLRVGGRGSAIDDRRNWDAYLVDGKVKRLMPEQGKRMQGFPETFEFPVTQTQAMKQLGNSVAVDAVQACGKALLKYLATLHQRQGINHATRKTIAMKTTKNKGEWTEIYSFLKIINDKKLILADSQLATSNNSSFFNISKVSTLNISEEVQLFDDNCVVLRSDGNESVIPIASIISDEVLQKLFLQIKSGSATFNIPDFDTIQNKLGLSIIKGGNSSQKADIIMDIHNDTLQKKDEGFGIKSYVGSKPTLLNASGNTNFIFSVQGLDKSYIDQVNNIKSRTKLKDRLNKINSLGGELVFSHVEKESMQYNLEMVDSNMPKILSEMLLSFYLQRNNRIKENIRTLNIEATEKLEVKIKRLLVAILLGFFAGKKWDGKYIANGAIVVKETGEQVGFHIIELSNLEDYLFDNIKFDTPSTTRHRYGSLYTESNGKMYFKLNMQLRF